jgi:hypothetical protein
MLYPSSVDLLGPAAHKGRLVAATDINQISCIQYVPTTLQLVVFAIHLVDTN